MDHSWQELEAASHVLNSMLRGTNPRPGSRELFQDYLKASSFDGSVNDIDPDLLSGASYFQWDMATNSVQVAIEDIDGSEPAIASVIGIHVVQAEPDHADATPPPCISQRCGPLRGGVMISNPSGKCSAGGAGTYNSNPAVEILLTAAHCNNANWNRRTLLGSGSYANWFLTYSTTLTGGVVPGEGFYNGSRFDGQA